MMKIHNLGLQESVGVKFINGICDKFCLKRLKATGIFVRLLSQGCFWSRNKDPNNESLHKVSSEAAVHKCSSK